MSHAKSTCPRQSARLSQKRHDRRMTDCLVPDSQPEQNEPLVVIPPTTSGFRYTNFIIHFFTLSKPPNLYGIYERSITIDTQ